MSSENDDDEVPLQEVRQAVQQAARGTRRVGAMAAVPRPVMPDVYMRETDALLKRGMAYDDVMDCVTLRMGLVPDALRGNTQVWFIKQSPKWIALEAVFDNKMLQSWALLRTNGSS